MKKGKNREKMVTVPEAGLVDLVASKLKGVALFPEKLEQAKEFLKKAKLKQGKKVNRDTVSNALTSLRNQYQKRDRLEATTSLQKQTYNQPIPFLILVA